MFQKDDISSLSFYTLAMEYIQDFLRYMKYERRCSPLTVDAYANDMRLFQQFMDTYDIYDPREVTSRHLRRWIMYLLSNGMKARSVNRKIASCRSYFKYLCREKIIENNPSSLIDNVKTPKVLPIFLHEPEMDLMLNEENFPDTYEGIRDKMILELFYSSGLRVSELTNLTDNQINLSRNIIVVLGKRKKERIIPLTDALKLSIISYLQRRNKEFGCSAEGGRVFLTKKGDDIYTKLIYRVVRKHIEMVSTISKKSPHVLRHTFATVLLNNGADLMSIKELLGHSSLAATQIYAHTDFEQLNKVYKQAHPMGNK